MNIAITGANRGIGLELVRQCLSRGDAVFAGARDPDSAPELRKLTGHLVVLPCDVASDTSVQRFAHGVEAPVDALINNAGIIGTNAPLQSVDFDEALHVLSVNALGPLRLTAAFLPHLRRGVRKRILHVTSLMGSIADNRSGGYYAYRMSKAALNMASKSLALELRREGVLSAVIHPGWVQTDMGGTHAPMRVEDSARGILEQLDAMTSESSGQFLDVGGRHWPW
jgi:NAD(P)-dependent dehydrogenase (short-subunit alcohol dehydrogenase family)